MAEYGDSLVRRGLISPDAAARVTPTFADRLSAYGTPSSENVEDRRGEPDSGYGHMLATNNLVGAIMRHLFPSLRSLDLNLPQAPYRKRQAGQLPEQIGSYDIKRGK